MKKTVLLLILIINSFVLFSQSVGSGLQCLMSNKNNAKSGVSLFADRFSFLEINGERYVSLIAKIANESAVSDLERMGCKVYSRSGDIITLRAKEETLEDLIHYNGLLKIETARKTTSPLLDDAIEDINADYVHQGLELPQGFDGEGVIIGIADWGFDYTHPVFYDTLMQDYRVIAAWDQYRLAGNPPEGFDYGSEIVGKDALLAAQCDTNNIYDRGYHGTHVASIAAGGGASTQYKGVAYGAQLLFATWMIDEAAVLDAYTWMKNVAKAQNKRLVVNNSWGIYHFGYMDGSSMFDEFVYKQSKKSSANELYIVIQHVGKDEYGHKQTGEEITIGKIDINESKKYADFYHWKRQYSTYDMWMKDYDDYQRKYLEIDNPYDTSVRLVPRYEPKSIR